MSEKTKVSIMIFLLAVVVALIVFFTCTTSGIAIINTWRASLQEVDNDTNYQTKKEVEDTCRAMISSYTADKLTYEQYKDSDDEEKQSWAEQAKMRVNRTASTYNNYILKNNNVWKNDVPSDIYTTLEYIN